MSAPTLVPPDFFDDWRRFLKAGLRRMGAANPDDQTEFPDNKLDIIYFAALSRMVPVRKRTVHRASDLSVPKELRAGFDALVEKIEVGHDLSPHLSRLTGDVHKKDRLLSDWGLHHLHLGTQVEDDGFVNRTGPVLFARFERDDAYLVDVREHGSGKKAVWGKIEMLETILREWPYLLEPCVMTGLHGGENANAEETVDARGDGVQQVLTLSDGRVYGPLGGGLATDGTPTRAVSTADWWWERIQAAQACVKTNFEDFCEKAQEQGAVLPERVEMHLVFGEDGLFAVVEGAQVKWRVG